MVTKTLVLKIYTDETKPTGYATIEFVDVQEGLAVMQILIENDAYIEAYIEEDALVQRLAENGVHINVHTQEK